LIHQQTYEFSSLDCWNPSKLRGIVCRARYASMIRIQNGDRARPSQLRLEARSNEKSSSELCVN
jgi:hypothetical protein